MAKIRFNSLDSEREVVDGISILDAADELGVGIESQCNGRGKCGKCKVQVTDGDENLSPLTESEEKLLSEEEIARGYRLSCLTEIIGGEVRVKVPKSSLRKGQIILTEGREIDFEKDPIVRDYPLRIREPTFEDCKADYERIKNQLNQDYDILVKDIDKLVQMDLPTLLRRERNIEEGTFEVTANVWDNEIIGVFPGRNTSNYGIAVDVGTTTLVGYLVNLDTGKTEAISSILNPQVRFGEDLMTRITYTVENENGREELKQVLVSGLNDIINDLEEKAEISREVIGEAVLVGNTAMHHLFLGIESRYLARSPFPPARQSSMKIKARDIEVDINPSGYIYWLPINGGWVGADNVAVMLVARIYEQQEMTLVIDIGTNGEVAVGNENGVLVTSTAAGPAFEGAEIKHGMRATSGSIEKVRIDLENLHPIYEIIGEGKPIGICGSGIIDAAAEMLKSGIIERNGGFEEKKENDRVRRDEDGILEYVLVWEEETAIDSDIAITQKDIREIQKAKGAIQAAARVLMDILGIEQIEKVLLAGAFGNYIDKKSAMTIGLYPECDLDKVESLGNAAGIGAKLALLDNEERKEAEKIPETIKFVSIGGRDEFEENYMKTMYFPHKDLSLYPEFKKKFPKIK